ncbi:hypothetical protein [Bradyrhizobium sp. USDA 3650]
MRLACAVLFLVLALPAMAQQASALTLSCDGVVKLLGSSAAHTKPIKAMGVIVDLAEKKVSVSDRTIPIKSSSDTLISFGMLLNPIINGQILAPAQVTGSIDRVTGSATIYWWYANEESNEAWVLTCRPATRLF